MRATFALIACICLSLVMGCDQQMEQGAAAPAPAAVPRQPGIALAVVLDVSGSMTEKTRDGQGQMRPKIDVAKEVVVQIVEQTAQWAQRHPDEAIHLGVLAFDDRARVVQPMVRIHQPGSPEQQQVVQAVSALKASGSTAIGDAATMAAQLLDQQNLALNYVLMVTDGENTAGLDPRQAAQRIGQAPPSQRPTFYLIAFDISDQKFSALRAFDWRVLPAADGGKLQQTIDEVVGGEILLEK